VLAHLAKHRIWEGVINAKMSAKHAQHLIIVHLVIMDIIRFMEIVYNVRMGVKHVVQ